MRLTIRHLTDHDYDPAPKRIALRLKLFPATTRSQTPSGWQVRINGEEVRPMLTNGFGDAEALWFADTATTRVEVVAEGSVATSDTAGVIGKIGVAPPELYLRNTTLTRLDENIHRLAEAAVGDTPLARMHALSAAVHEAMVYRPGVTGSDTTAAQALALGAGVCQDKSHLLIAAARAAGIPARYVVGYLHDANEPLSETHAWAEAHLEGLGWVGFDPTHQLCPTDAYVRLCSGLDADDASPIRGSIQGATADRMQVSVSVAYAQSQQ